jgi:alkylation response protein AidB-like acyl-CoA dehydrogenase
MEMSFSFEEVEIQRSVRRFVQRELLPIRKAVEHTGELPAAVQEKFLALGLLGAVFPQSYGALPLS